jgi:threonyl-tRNA synthetase
MEALIVSIQVKLPDGAVREYEQGVTIADVAGSISSGLKKSAVWKFTVTAQRI